MLGHRLALRCARYLCRRIKSRRFNPFLLLVILFRAALFFLTHAATLGPWVLTNVDGE